MQDIIDGQKFSFQHVIDPFLEQSFPEFRANHEHLFLNNGLKKRLVGYKKPIKHF